MQQPSLAIRNRDQVYFGDYVDLPLLRPGLVSAPRIAPNRAKLAVLAAIAGLHIALVAGAVIFNWFGIDLPKKLDSISVSILSEPQKTEALPQPAAPPIRPFHMEIPPPLAPVETPAPSTAAVQTNVALPAASPRRQADYYGSLMAHIQRLKRYPGEARNKREQGVVLVEFSLNRNGFVLASRIARSSGYPALDAEALSLIGRVQPMPPFPADFPQDRLDIQLPIEFSLR